MARDISGLRIAKIHIDRAGNTTEESQEADFDLARGEGIALHRVEFAVEPVVTADDDHDTRLGYVSLHAENDALEATFDELSGESFEQDSEIIAESGIVCVNQDEAATRGGSAATYMWLGPNFWNYREISGRPLVIAINPTFRAQVNDAGLVMDALCTIYYNYVELNDAEVREAFFRMR